MDTILSVKNISKSFATAAVPVPVLKDVSFDVKSGDFLIIFGPSGCGKSTLLHTILGLEEPNHGTVMFLNTAIYDHKTEDERSDFRKVHVGMVYQQPNWIKSLTVLENVAFPLTLLGIEKLETLKRARSQIAEVGMTDWADYIPTELSSGQQQKVSLARALITDPEVIIADEPTGNLDFESGQELMEILTKLNRNGKTILMVTHDLEYLKFARTAIRMFNGTIAGIYGEKDKEKLERDIKTKRGNHDH